MARKKFTTDAPQQIIDGRKYAMTFGGPPFTEECCDCGLVHKVRYTVELGRLFVQYTVDKKLTDAARERRAKSGEPTRK